MDDVGPHLNELRTFDGELQPTIIDAVDDNVSIAGIGDRSNGSMDDRQPIGSNERAATIGTDHTDNHHTVVVDAERRSAFLSEHPNGHGRWPHQEIAFDWDDHRRSSEYQRMTNDQTTSDDDIDLDRRCERRQKVELDRTETGNEFDRRRERTTGGIDPIGRLGERGGHNSWRATARRKHKGIDAEPSPRTVAHIDSTQRWLVGTGAAANRSRVKSGQHIDFLTGARARHSDVVRPEAGGNDRSEDSPLPHDEPVLTHKTEQFGVGLSGDEPLGSVRDGRDRNPERQRLRGDKHGGDKSDRLSREYASAPNADNGGKHRRGEQRGGRLSKRCPGYAGGLRRSKPLGPAPPHHDNDCQPDHHGEPIRPTKPISPLDHIDGLRSRNHCAKNEQDAGVGHFCPGARHHVRQPPKGSADIGKTKAKPYEHERQSSIVRRKHCNESEHPGDKADGGDRQLRGQRTDPWIPNRVSSP